MGIDNRFFVFGDSHVRSLVDNLNFVPIFIGQGRDHNFVTLKSLFRIFIKVHYIAMKVKQKSNVIFFFGEPDTRYAMGNGWYPWDNKGKSVAVSKYLIEQSAHRYLALIDVFRSLTGWNVFVLSVLPTRQKEQFPFIQRFNTVIRSNERELDFTFIDIETSFLKNDGTIQDEFVGDKIHANTGVQKFVEDFLIKKGFLNNAGASDRVRSGRELKIFYRSNRFGNKILTDSMVSMCVFLLRHYVIKSFRERWVKRPRIREEE